MIEFTEMGFVSGLKLTYRFGVKKSGNGEIVYQSLKDFTGFPISQNLEFTTKSHGPARND